MTDIREDLKAYVDGELSESRRIEVESAIADNPELEREVLLLRRLSYEITQVARDVDVVGASETLARLRKRKAPFWAPLFGAAACLLLAVILYPLVAPPMAYARRTSRDMAAEERSRSTAASAPALKSFPAPAAREAKANENDKGERELFEKKNVASQESAKYKRGGGGFPILPAIERTITVASLDKAVEKISKLGTQTIFEKTDAGASATFANTQKFEPDDTITLVVPESELTDVLAEIQMLDVRTKGVKKSDARFQSPASSGGGTAAGAASPEKMVTVRIKLKLPAPVRDPR